MTIRTIFTATILAASLAAPAQAATFDIGGVLSTVSRVFDGVWRGVTRGSQASSNSPEEIEIDRVNEALQQARARGDDVAVKRHAAHYNELVETAAEASGLISTTTPRPKGFRLSISNNGNVVRAARPNGDDRRWRAADPDDDLKYDYDGALRNDNNYKDGKWTGCLNRSSC